MPAGRVRVSGGTAWGALPSKIGIDTLLRYRNANSPPLSCRDLRDLHDHIRDAANRYRLAHGAPVEQKNPGALRHQLIPPSRIRKRFKTPAGPVTRTEAKAILAKIRKNAVRASDSSFAEPWVGRLIAALSSVRPSLLADLHSTMRRQGVDISKLRARLNPTNVSAEDKRAICALATIEPNAIVRPSGHPDPPLVQLVSELAPVWCRAIGRSPKPRGGTKRSPFALWIAELIKATGKQYPPAETAIGGILQGLKIKK